MVEVGEIERAQVGYRGPADRRSAPVVGLFRVGRTNSNSTATRPTRRWNIRREAPAGPLERLFQYW